MEKIQNKNYNLQNNNYNLSKNKKIIINILGKYHCLDLSKNNFKDITVKNLYKLCETKFNITKNKFNLIYNNKILKQVHDLNENDKLIIIKLIPKLKGGGALMDFLNIIFDIGQIFVFLIKSVEYIIRLLIWLIKFFVWFLTEVANPYMFFTDFMNSIKVVTTTLVIGPIKFIMFLVKKLVNGLLENTLGSFWGWDRQPKDAWDYHKAAYFNSGEECRGKKCYVTKSGKIPFSILIGTIVCPPIGVFMEYGFTGWLNILVCILLTFLFYFPGLMYALFCIYS